MGGAKVQGTPLYQAAATTPYLADASYVAAPRPYIGYTPLVAAAQPYMANSYAVAAAKPYLADSEAVAAAKPYLADTAEVAAAKPYLADAPYVAAAKPYLADTPAVAAAKPYLADAAYVAAAKPYLADTKAVSDAKVEFKKYSEYIQKYSELDAAAAEAILAPVSIPSIPVAKYHTPLVVAPKVFTPINAPLVSYHNAAYPYYAGFHGMPVVTAPIVSKSAKEAVEAEE